MQKPPRDPKKTIANPLAVAQWLFYGLLIFLTALLPLLLFADQASSTEPNVPVTMTFAVAALGSIFAGLVTRRDPESGLEPPILAAIKWLSIPLVLTIATVELGFLQNIVGTTSLDGRQWLLVLGLALIVPVVIELEKWIRRTRTRRRAHAEAVPAR